MPAETYALGDNAYASPEDLAGLGGEFAIPSGFSADAVKKAVLLRASKQIDSITGQHFGYSTLTLTLDGTGTILMRTASALSWRLVDITSIYVRDEPDDAWDTQVATTKYALSMSRRAIRRTDGDVWVKGIRNYRVIGHFGRKYVPEPIKWACVLLARNDIVPGSASAYEQMQSETFGDGYSYTRRNAAVDPVPAAFSTGVPTVDAILSRYIYRRPLLGVPGA